MQAIKKKEFYFVNGFTLIIRNISSSLDYQIVEFFPNGTKFLTIRNFFSYFYKRLRGNLKKYSVIHINTWETFFHAKKSKWQVLIGESHGYHFWLNFQDTLQHFSGVKKIIAYAIEFFFGHIIRQKIRNAFDIYYVSTPNMLRYAKHIRKDAKWLPNCLNVEIFQRDWEKETLVGDPVIFFPTRLHSFKNPQFWIELFQKIKKQYPNATLHLIRYPHWGDPMAKYYSNTLQDSDTYVWHNFKTKDELAKMYRASKIVLGSFHSSLWTLSQVELEAIACHTAVISYDRFEIQTQQIDLENICFQLLRDNQFYENFISKNYNSIIPKHTKEYIANIIHSDISFIKNWFQTIALTRKNILKHSREIIDIDIALFSDIWPRWESEFIYDIPNKFECSFWIVYGKKLIGYIIWSFNGESWYIHRIGISEKFQWCALGKRLLEYFEDTIKYVFESKYIYLVTHNSLNVDSFYIKNRYVPLKTKEQVERFLIKKSKQNHISEYYGNQSIMNIYYKEL